VMNRLRAIAAGRDQARGLRQEPTPPPTPAITGRDIAAE